MDGLNIADVLEAVAQHRTDADALVHGDRRVSWAEFARRADGVAHTLLTAGARRHDKVALYLRNDPAYLETMLGCCKASLVPVNTNYRYTDDELVALWDNADAVAVVFHGSFTDTVDRIRTRVPAVRTWVWVDDGTDACPDWARPYDEAAAGAGTISGTGRSGADLVFIYTGGTTGLPKAVMWEQDTLVRLLLADQGATEPAATAPSLAARAADVVPGPCVIACPLMHGTGLCIALAHLMEGGTVVTTPGTGFDAEVLLDTIEQQRAERLAIVGDAFARPIVEALEAHPARWDLSSLAVVGSSGVMWSEPVKQALLAHLPGLLLLDLLGSSEALGLGSSMATADAPGTTARFAATELTVVVGEDGAPVEPGSGAIGRLGMVGLTPVGYYKDPERSAATFPVIDGVRYALPGDWATVAADGSIELLGRGSVCINTGGEKVFPEEVEEVCKTHDAVADVVVVGVPDERFGERVVAVVELAAGADPDDVDGAALVDHVRAQLADFKVPRQVVRIDTIGRAPNGKVDYARMREHALEELGART